MHPKTAIIVSTYNSAASLRKCLVGLQAQTQSDFEVVIADDGSSDETASLLRDPNWADLTIRHVWQPDDGYRVRMVRNRAIRMTNAEFLIFLDGDCVPRRDFVASHRRYCPRSRFVSGARVDVPASVHRHFTDDEIFTNRVFDAGFLARRDASLRRYRWRLREGAWYVPLANWLTWRYCVFVSSNGSAWREDLLRVNGFDESYPGYGSDDRDLGVRLRNSGVRPGYRKFSLIVLHLDHSKPYYDPRQVRQNRRVFKRRFRDGTTWVPLGIDNVLERS